MDFLQRPLITFNYILLGPRIELSQVWNFISWNYDNQVADMAVKVDWLCGYIVDSRDQRESRKNLDLDNFWLVSRNLGLDNLEIVVSTESRSRQLTNHESRANLDLDNFENLSLVQVSISTIYKL